MPLCFGAPRNRRRGSLKSSVEEWSSETLVGEFCSRCTSYRSSWLGPLFQAGKRSDFSTLVPKILERGEYGGRTRGPPHFIPPLSSIIS